MMGATRSACRARAQAVLLVEPVMECEVLHIAEDAFVTRTA